METYEQQAELVDYPVDPRTMSPYAAQEYIEQDREEESELFHQPNDLKVIQEYNREENMPSKVRKKFWALSSKSIKLGFWKQEDLYDVFLHKNIIKLGHIMSNPRSTYTFEDRQVMNQMDMLVYADFKRGVGMERYKINERTLQATSVQQHIQGGGSVGKQGGVLAGLKRFFG